MLLRIYIPKPGSLAETAFIAGSAIVGTPIGDTGTIVVDAEGNKYGASNLDAYHERLICAGGRHKDRYPTVARWRMRDEDLIEIGLLNTDTWMFNINPESVNDYDNWISRYGS